MVVWSHVPCSLHGSSALTVIVRTPVCLHAGDGVELLMDAIDN